jgi:hypothetical protein
MTRFGRDFAIYTKQRGGGRSLPAYGGVRISVKDVKPEVAPARRNTGNRDAAKVETIQWTPPRPAVRSVDRRSLWLSNFCDGIAIVRTPWLHGAPPTAKARIST